MRLELLDLGGLAEWVAVRDLGLGKRLVVELTLMALGISVLPTVAVPASALEPSQAELLLAARNVAPAMEQLRENRENPPSNPPSSHVPLSATMHVDFISPCS